jgi:hypothetical protein
MPGQESRRGAIVRRRDYADRARCAIYDPVLRNPARHIEAALAGRIDTSRRLRYHLGYQERHRRIIPALRRWNEILTDDDVRDYFGIASHERRVAPVHLRDPLAFAVCGESLTQNANEFFVGGPRSRTHEELPMNDFVPVAVVRQTFQVGPGPSVSLEWHVHSSVSPENEVARMRHHACGARDRRHHSRSGVSASLRRAYSRRCCRVNSAHDVRHCTRRRGVRCVAADVLDLGGRHHVPDARYHARHADPGGIPRRSQLGGYSPLSGGEPTFTRLPRPEPRPRAPAVSARDRSKGAGAHQAGSCRPVRRIRQRWRPLDHPRRGWDTYAIPAESPWNDGIRPGTALLCVPEFALPHLQPPSEEP